MADQVEEYEPIDDQTGAEAEAEDPTVEDEIPADYVGPTGGKGPDDE